MHQEEAQKDKTALVPQCPKCHKAHPGEYRLGNNSKCSNYSKEGYFARECRNAPAKTVEPPPQGRLNAQVYRLNKGDVEAGSSTSVSGQLPVSNLSLYALINFGATHSFIAKRTS